MRPFDTRCSDRTGRRPDPCNAATYFEYRQRYLDASCHIDPKKVWGAAERLRKQRGAFAELPATQAEFEKQWREKDRKRIEEAEQTAARGSETARFVGGVAGAMTDPVNIATLPFGGWGKTIGQKVLTEALVNGAFPGPSASGERFPFRRMSKRMSARAR